MSEASFRTAAEVVGYSHAPARKIYRGFELECVDVSGASSFGYKFALRAKALEASIDPMSDAVRAIEHRSYARSVTLWFTEAPDKLGRPGCFGARWFRDADIAAADEAFVADVDRFWGAP